jgi:hypothetical protein
VEVTIGDVNPVPADHVYVEAYGWVGESQSYKSFVLRMPHKGHYEISLPPGVYDVFVSQDNSVPRCRRVLVRSGLTTYWVIKLEVDDVYANT